MVYLRLGLGLFYLFPVSSIIKACSLKHMIGKLQLSTAFDYSNHNLFSDQDK